MPAEATISTSLNITGFTWQTTSDEVAQTFKQNIQNRTFFITGTTIDSIGFQTALSLASQNPKLLILAGCSESKLQAAVDSIQAQYPGTNITTVLIDLSSLASVRQAAASITVPLDVIINNAAIMAPPTYTTTSDGFEAQFACNHLSHFLLTNLLLPRLLPGGRVINVSSAAYSFGNVNFNDINFSSTPYNKWAAYGQSKTANMLFSLALAERGVEGFSLNPGAIAGTGLGRKMTEDELGELVKQYDGPESRIPLKSLQPGAATTLVAALDGRIKGYNGGFLEDGDLAVPTEEYACDKRAAERLWRISEGAVGEKFGF